MSRYDWGEPKIPVNPEVRSATLKAESVLGRRNWAIGPWRVTQRMWCDYCRAEQWGNPVFSGLWSQHPTSSWFADFPNDGSGWENLQETMLCNMFSPLCFLIQLWGVVVSAHGARVSAPCQTDPKSASFGKVRESVCYAILRMYMCIIYIYRVYWCLVCHGILFTTIYVYIYTYNYIAT